MILTLSTNTCSLKRLKRLCKKIKTPGGLWGYPNPDLDISKRGKQT